MPLMMMQQHAAALWCQTVATCPMLRPAACKQLPNALRGCRDRALPRRPLTVCCGLAPKPKRPAGGQQDGGSSPAALYNPEAAGHALGRSGAGSSSGTRRGQGGAVIITLQEAEKRVRQVFQGLTLLLHKSLVNPSSGVLAARPAATGTAGKPIEVLVNHFHVYLSSAKAAHVFRCTVKLAQQQQSVKSSKQQKQQAQGQASCGTEAAVRAVDALAAAEGLEAGTWLLDAPAGSLYTIANSLLPHDEKEWLVHDGTAAAGKQGAAYQVTTAYQRTLQLKDTPAFSQQLAAAVESAPTPPAPPPFQEAVKLLVLLWHAAVTAAAPGAINGSRTLLPPQQQQQQQADAALAAADGAATGKQQKQQKQQKQAKQGKQQGQQGQQGHLQAPTRLLSGGPLQLWEGFRAAFTPSSSGITLALDPAIGAVVPKGPLSQQLLALPGMTAAQLPGLGRNKGLLKQVDAYVRGTQVQVDYRSYPARLKLQSMDPRAPSSIAFKHAGRTTDVATYLQGQYGVSLVHPEWPCVKDSKGACYPLELCRVTKVHERKDLNPRQTSDFIRLAALRPADRFLALQRLLGRVLGSFKLAMLLQWGVSVAAELLKLPARLLPTAPLQYGNNKCVDTKGQGSWTHNGLQLAAPAALHSWAVVNLASASGLSQGAAEDFAQFLASAVQRNGSTAAPVPVIVDAAGHKSAEAALTAAANKAEAVFGAKPELLVVVLPPDAGTKHSAQYSTVKRHAALSLGIPTQCIISDTLAKPEQANSIAANLADQINAKLGGRNHQLPRDPSVWAPVFKGKRVMVLGADVSHPADGSKAPSVAAVVGSMDREVFRFSAELMQQAQRHEIIVGMCEAVGRLLRQHASSNQAASQKQLHVEGSAQQGAAEAGQERLDDSDAGGPGSSSQVSTELLPEVLVVFRDGVADSMYLAVLQQECAAIKQACADVGDSSYQPAITFIVVSTSHATRLMPISVAQSAKAGSAPAAVGRWAGNVPPGTVVDHTITHPLNYEFFLNSHAGIQGTNKPARYNVLLNESGLAPDAVQLLTYWLCGTHGACSRSLSVPVAARYADRAAAAAAAYLLPQASPSGNTKGNAGKGAKHSASHAPTTTANRASGAKSAKGGKAAGSEAAIEGEGAAGQAGSKSSTGKTGSINVQMYQMIEVPAVFRDAMFYL